MEINKIINKYISILILILCYFVILVNPVQAQSLDTLDCDNGFTTLFSGITHKEVTFTSPRPIVANIVRVDLDNPSIDIVVTPECNLGMTTSNFLGAYGAEVAVNGGGFYPGFDPTGLAAAEGVQYSDGPNDGAIFAFLDNSVRLFGRGGQELWDAVDSMNVIVRGGDVDNAIAGCGQPGYCVTLHPRTSIGLTGSNELILMVVDGRQTGYSEGVTLLELANMMLSCDADNAGSMDGGGSSTMVVSGQGVMNSPSDGSERVVANHFGVCVGSCASAACIEPPPGSPGNPPDVPPTYPTAPYCDLREYRSNPGDNLFPTELLATVQYTAQITCTYTVPGEGRVCNLATGGDPDIGEDHCYPLPHEDWDCDTYYGQVDCNPGYFCGEECSPPGACAGENDLCVNGSVFPPIYTDCCPGFACTGEIPYNPDRYCEPDPLTIDTFEFTETCANTVPISFRTVTQTPLAEEVWDRLVYSPSSVFRRIFPQIEDEEGRPIRRLWAIPAATSVAFRSLTGDTVIAGNPNNATPGNQAELYFPYIGGIHQYFLRCTQTLLRPQGYGEYCPQDFPQLNVPDTTVDICSEPCNPDPTNVNLAGVEAKCQDLALRWIEGGNPLEENCGTVINTALAAGVDPIFAVAIWLHESGASNYTGICQVLGGGDCSAGYCQRIADFGIIRNYSTSTNCGVTWNSMFTTQMNAFMNLPGYYLSVCGTSQANCPMEIFGSMFHSGTCTPTDVTNGYIAGIRGIYEWLAPGQMFPCYPIRLP